MTDTNVAKLLHQALQSTTAKSKPRRNEKSRTKAALEAENAKLRSIIEAVKALPRQRMLNYMDAPEVVFTRDLDRVLAEE